jgi:hypothetical protein
MRAKTLGLVGFVLLFAGCSAPVAEDEQQAPLPVVGEVEPKNCAPNCPPTNPEVRIHPTINNGTGRPTFLVQPLIIDAIRAELLSHPEIDVDEGNEPTNTNHALEVFGSLGQASFSGTQFTVKCQLTVFTYPGLDLRGSIPKTLINQNVNPRDTATQNSMISMCATLATATFAANVEAFY